MTGRIDIGQATIVGPLRFILLADEYDGRGKLCARCTPPRPRGR